MKTLTFRLARRLSRDCEGSAVVEFALLGPTFIALMLGVLQIGLGMQNYNALRSVATDTMRHAVIDYQSKDVANRATSLDLANYARTIAVKAPYGLKNTALSVKVDSVATSRVTGALEKTITLSYNIPTVLEIIGIDDIPITYSQPIFLVEG